MAKAKRIVAEVRKSHPEIIKIVDKLERIFFFHLSKFFFSLMMKRSRESSDGGKGGGKGGDLAREVPAIELVNDITSESEPSLRMSKFVTASDLIRDFGVQFR
jgi:hypothetical protein